MPKKFGKTMEQISYNCPSDLLNRINDETKIGNFSSRSEFITLALKSYFENRDTEVNIQEEIKKFLTTSDGEALIQAIYEKYNKKPKKIM